MSTHPEYITMTTGDLKSSTNSLPATPEPNRRNSQLRNNLMTSSLIDKREKSEFNNQLRYSSGLENNSRPLSYHGNHDNFISKRHISSLQGGGGGGGGGGGKVFKRRSLGGSTDKKFDVTELDTNLPRIDMEAIEFHLRTDREIDRKRRSDRDEIRRRLADSSITSNDEEKSSSGSSRKNLQSRLQSSMNLQICFMNETASDESSAESSPDSTENCQKVTAKAAPNLLEKKQSDLVGRTTKPKPKGSEDFVKKQSRLQAEARHALAQAKDLARLQIAQSRLERSSSPISEMVRKSLDKVGVRLPTDRRRVSRQLLTEMNVTQLQVIVNDLHSHIEGLNEKLVSMLLERDDLHMEQDSMLVDIEDLTRYL